MHNKTGDKRVVKNYHSECKVDEYCKEKYHIFDNNIKVSLNQCIQ